MAGLVLWQLTWTEQGGSIDMNCHNCCHLCLFYMTEPPCLLLILLLASLPRNTNCLPWLPSCLQFSLYCCHTSVSLMNVSYCSFLVATARCINFIIAPRPAHLSMVASCSRVLCCRRLPFSISVIVYDLDIILPLSHRGFPTGPFTGPQVLMLGYYLIPRRV